MHSPGSKSEQYEIGPDPADLLNMNLDPMIHLIGVKLQKVENRGHAISLAKNSCLLFEKRSIRTFILKIMSNISRC